MTKAGSEGVGLETLGVLVKFSMSKEMAGKVKRRFAELSRDGSDVSYLDCVLFDAALSALGEEQSYYGIDDETWEDAMKQRSANEARYEAVKIVDVTDNWRIA